MKTVADKWKMKRVVTGGLFVLSVGLAVLYACRNLLLRSAVEARLERIEKDIQLDIACRELCFDGVRRVRLEGLSLVPADRDTLLDLDLLKVELSLWGLVCGRVDVKRVEMEGLRLDFLKQGGEANYDFLFVSRQGPDGTGGKEPAVTVPAHTDYARRTDWLLDAVFDLLPADARLADITVHEQNDSNSVELRIPELCIRDRRFESRITFEENGCLQHWYTSGEVNPSDKRVTVSFGAPDLTVPYIGRRFGADVKFDSLRCSFARVDGGGKIRIVGQAEVDGLQVYHRRLSPEAVSLDHGAVDFHVQVENDAIQLDSTSTVRFNTLSFNPFVCAERVLPGGGIRSWHFIVSVRKPWFQAEELFGSFPSGLFEHLEGMKVDGELAYDGFLDVDFSRIDSLRIGSELKSRNFRILKSGNSDLRKMSGEFEYTAYEDGVPVRTFPVGPSWNHFLPLDSIPLTMRTAVLQSEDGAFFYHQGFLMDALREAMIYDLKKGKFARGGSTISMQLVKNVFLNRNKNLSRKLEEALIVWLIETGHLTSKQRMYEVYLNIAEWGPMVYGICEAADFYFAKRPSQLTLEECIFLASVIPRPKHFMWSFTEDGRLKDTQEGYFRLIGERLVVKGVITGAQAAAIDISKVVLRGRAKEWFRSDVVSRIGQDR